MRLITFEIGGRRGWGAIRDGEVVDLLAAAALAGETVPDSLASFIVSAASVDSLRELVRAAPSRVRFGLHEIRSLAPIPRPTKNVFCVGRNYVEHVEEWARAGRDAVDIPEFPVWFTKPPTSVAGPDEPVAIDTSVTQRLDWEVELGVVLGRTGRDIPEASALDYVFGYTIVNDLSARDLQTRTNQWFKGKSLDGLCPMGPWIVTADEIADPQHLHLWLRVSGVIKQDASTSLMIFSVRTLIADLSAGMTLEAGDVIATGTPSGVGDARVPQEYLHPGDVVEAGIDEIGVLRTPIVAYERNA